jgi:hypothetical protein
MVVIMHLQEVLEVLEDMEHHLLEGLERKLRLDMEEEDHMEDQEEQQEEEDLLPLAVMQCHQVPILSYGVGSPLSTLIDRDPSIPLS